MSSFYDELNNIYGRCDEYYDDIRDSVTKISVNNKIIQYPTQISQCFTGHFTSISQIQILLNRSNALQIVEFDHEHVGFKSVMFVLVKEHIIYALPLNLGHDKLDLIFVITSDNIMSLMKWDGFTFKSTLPVDNKAMKLEENRKGIKNIDCLYVSNIYYFEKESEFLIKLVFQYLEDHYYVLCAMKKDDVWSASLISITNITSNSSDESMFVRSILKLLEPKNNTLQLVIFKEFITYECFTRIISFYNLYQKTRDSEYTAQKLYEYSNLNETATILLDIKEDIIFSKDMGRKFNRTTSFKSNGGILLLDRSSVVYCGYVTCGNVKNICNFNVLSWSLSSAPRCFINIGSHEWIIATGMDLYYLSINNDALWFRINITNMKTIVTPSSICYISPFSSNSQGTLIVTSLSGDTNILQALKSENDINNKQSYLSWKNLRKRTLVSNLAIIKKALVYSSNTESEEKSLLICGGTFGEGHLAKTCLSKGIKSIYENDSKIGDGAKVLSFKDAEADEFDSFLCFTYDISSCTRIMSIKNKNFHYIEIPGFDHHSHTTHIQCLLEEYLVQVTNHRVIILNRNKDLVDFWECTDRINHVSIYKNLIVISNKLCLTHLSFDGSVIEKLYDYMSDSEISAITSFNIYLNQNFECNYTIISQWFTDIIIIFESGKYLQEFRIYSISDQIKSMVVVKGNKKNFLLLGTSNGAVLFINFTINKYSKHLLFEPFINFVQVGLSMVTLHIRNGDSVIAHCEEAAIFELYEQGSCLKASRLFLGNNKCISLTCLHCSTIRDGLAWIVKDTGKLMFASLDLDLKMHWTSVHMDDTMPISCAFYKQKNLFVVLSDEPSRLKMLHLINANTLENRMSMKMTGYDYKDIQGVIVAELPSLDIMERYGLKWKETNKQMKEYIITWSGIEPQRDGNNAQGCFSVFDVTSNSIGNISNNYALKLKGNVILSSYPYCCKVVNVKLQIEDWKDDIIKYNKEKELERLSGSLDFIFKNNIDFNITWNWNWPILLLGCDQSIHAFRIFINDYIDNDCLTEELLQEFDTLNNIKSVSIQFDKAESKRYNKVDNIIYEEISMLEIDGPVNDLVMYQDNYIIASQLLGSFVFIKIDILVSMFQKQYIYLSPLLLIKQNCFKKPVPALNISCSGVIVVSTGKFHIQFLQTDFTKLEKFIFACKKEINNTVKLGLNDPKVAQEQFNCFIEKFDFSNANEITDAYPVYQLISGFITEQLGLQVVSFNNQGQRIDSKNNDNKHIFFYSGSGMVGFVNF